VWRSAHGPSLCHLTLETIASREKPIANQPIERARGSGGALDRVDVLLRDLIDRRIDRAHGETLRFERVDIIERGVKVKPPFHVAEHHGHAIVIGRDQLIRLVGSAAKSTPIGALARSDGGQGW
jgi:hypothetical protein